MNTLEQFEKVLDDNLYYTDSTLEPIQGKNKAAKACHAICKKQCIKQQIKMLEELISKSWGSDTDSLLYKKINELKSQL